MRRPYGLYTDRLTKAGHTVLRAGNVIDSVGTGPAELFGTRIGPRFMRGRQRIYTRDGGRIGVATGARLQFKFAHQSRYWWKFYNAARFELWRVDERGQAHAQGAHRAEGGLLPARPHPHAAADCGARRGSRTTRRAAPTQTPST